MKSGKRDFTKSGVFFLKKKKNGVIKYCI